MSASIARSLDGLTRDTEKALEQSEVLQKKVSELVGEVETLKRRKESLLEEYRSGLFCSGCGQTRSQILAKGEKFPHSGQTIIRPTAEQIAAKERELQAPIDSAQRRLDDTRKSLDEQRKRGEAGLEQIRLGGRLWRTASSYWDFAWGRAVHLRQQEDKRKQDDARRSLDRATGLARVRPDSREEVQTWTRLLEKMKEQSRTASAETAARTNEARARIAQENANILEYIKRGRLFARAVGPPGVPIYPSASDHEMGHLYQMGSIPPSTYTPLSSVSQFLGDYRSFGGRGSGLVSAPGSGMSPVGTVPAPAAPQPAAPVSPAAGRLLQQLP